jgi:hypothetical protein
MQLVSPCLTELSRTGVGKQINARVCVLWVLCMVMMPLMCCFYHALKVYLYDLQALAIIGRVSLFCLRHGGVAHCAALIDVDMSDGAVMMVPENLLACSKRPASW